jgi:hypothetical protein
LVLNRTIDPGKLVDLPLPLEQVGESNRVMDERRRHQNASAAMRNTFRVITNARVVK